MGTMLRIQRGNLGLLIVGALFLVVLGSVWAEAEHHPAEAEQAGLASLIQRDVREAARPKGKKNGAKRGGNRKYGRNKNVKKNRNSKNKQKNKKKLKGRHSFHLRKERTSAANCSAFYDENDTKNVRDFRYARNQIQKARRAK